MDEQQIKSGLEELWAKGQMKSDWELKVHTLESVTEAVSRIPKEFSKKSAFLEDLQTSQQPPLQEPIDQEPSREWYSLLGLNEKEKGKIGVLKSFTQDMGLTPGWVSFACVFRNHVRNIVRNFERGYEKQNY